MLWNWSWLMAALAHGMATPVTTPEPVVVELQAVVPTNKIASAAKGSERLIVNMTILSSQKFLLIPRSQCVALDRGTILVVSAGRTRYPPSSRYPAGAAALRGTLWLMARETTEDLTDAELEGLLHAAAEEEREGRTVHCADKDELRTFLEVIRSDSA